MRIIERGNVAKPVAPEPTVNDFDYALEEAARTLRGEVEAIASLADWHEAASQNLENDRPGLPRRDEPLDSEIALLISEIEKELAVVSVLADTLAARLRGIARERDRSHRSATGAMRLGV
jgi:hypothetical protein